MHRRGINNTSLVLAFELPESNKVLLFVGDAQRGNWRSWTEGGWQDGEKTITVRDLMSRTVLYKVGHHGSHGATLLGTEQDDDPNLSWLRAAAPGTDLREQSEDLLQLVPTGRHETRAR